MSRYAQLQSELRQSPHTWLVTGVAGFIGSNLLEALLRLDQTVVGFDNFSTGKRENLGEVESLVSPEQWTRFRFVEGDVRSAETCREICSGVDYVLHQAALGSVPRSIANPLASHDNNVTGLLHMLAAARDSKVKRFVYASSSSVYGDDPHLPKTEDRVGSPLSPYAATKAANELYAGVFARCYGLETIGLRYFNVFGPRQDPDGPYAAVIPKWICAMVGRQPIQINGDGETSRDFCYVSNVVQANLLAATATQPEASNRVYNVALNRRLTLNELHAMLARLLTPHLGGSIPAAPEYRDFRPGDVRHSQADISLAGKLLGYEPAWPVEPGLIEALPWYLRQHTR